MKANEAPKKIYITNFDIEALPKDEQLSERWGEVRIQDSDIEYTRTDAFIEKACKFIDERLNFVDNAWYIEGEVTIKDKVIDDFKNYMKGE